MADANRWYADVRADSTVTTGSFRNLRCGTGTRVEDITSRESLEQVVDGDFRKQLGLSVPLYEPGECKYEFEKSSFTTTILNLLFAESERKGKTRHFRMYLGPGSDGSSADKLSLDLKFNPWDTAITFFRPEWSSMRKSVFTQYDPFESWYTEQSDVWLDDVKTFYHHRPMRCVIVVHLYFHAQKNTDLLAKSAYLSCAKKCIDDSRFFSRRVQGQARDVEQEQKNEISNNSAYSSQKGIKSCGVY